MLSTESSTEIIWAKWYYRYYTVYVVDPERLYDICCGNKDAGTRSLSRVLAKSFRHARTFHIAHAIEPHNP